MAPHDDDLAWIEDELRRNRPEPRAELVAELSDRVAAPTRPIGRKEGGRLRLGLALGLLVVFGSAFAAIGAFGYAGTSARNAVEGTVGVVADVVRKEKSAPTARTQQSSRRVTAPAGSSPRLSGGVAASERFRPPGTTASLFQYPHFVVVCVSFGRKEFSIVIPQFLVPLFQPFIVNFGPCARP
jgi:hypothetical protein